MFVGEIENALDRGERKMGEAFVDLFGRRAKLLVGHNRVGFDASSLDCRATATPTGNAALFPPRSSPKGYNLFDETHHAVIFQQLH